MVYGVLILKHRYIIVRCNSKMTRKFLQSLIIFPIIIISYLIINAVLHADINYFFYTFFEKFIYLFIIGFIPIILSLILWLYISELTTELLSINGTLKYVIYSILNILLPTLILFVQILFNNDFRWNFSLLLKPINEYYFKEYGFLIFGLIPTLIKFLLDETIKLKNRNEQKNYT